MILMQLYFWFSLKVSYPLISLKYLSYGQIGSVYCMVFSHFKIKLNIFYLIYYIKKYIFYDNEVTHVQVNIIIDKEDKTDTGSNGVISTLHIYLSNNKAKNLVLFANNNKQWSSTLSSMESRIIF